MTATTITAAAVQAAPVFLDRDATIAKACRLIAETAADGARLIAFPEAFVPTYPDWAWRTTPWADGPARWYERLFDQAVVIPGPATDRLGKAARGADCYVSIGVNERDGGTLYQRPAVAGPRRRRARRASQAHAHRRRAARLGLRRRLHHAGVRHSDRPGSAG